MSLVKYGDAETINVIESSDIDANDTKQKIEDLKKDISKEIPSNNEMSN